MDSDNSEFEEGEVSDYESNEQTVIPAKDNNEENETGCGVISTKDQTMPIDIDEKTLMVPKGEKSAENEQCVSSDFQKCSPSGQFLPRGRYYGPRSYRPRAYDSWRGSWRFSGQPRFRNPSQYMFPPRYAPSQWRMVYPYPSYLPNPFVGSAEDYCMMMGPPGPNAPFPPFPHQGTYRGYFPQTDRMPDRRDESGHFVDKYCIDRRKSRAYTDAKHDMTREYQHATNKNSNDKLKSDTQSDSNINKGKSGGKDTGKKVLPSTFSGRQSTQQSSDNPSRNFEVAVTDKSATKSLEPTAKERQSRSTTSKLENSKRKFNRRFFGRESNGTTQSWSPGSNSTDRSKSGSRSRSGSSSSSSSTGSSDSSGSGSSSDCSCKDCTNNKNLNQKSVAPATAVAVGGEIQKANSQQPDEAKRSTGTGKSSKISKMAANSNTSTGASQKMEVDVSRQADAKVDRKLKILTADIQDENQEARKVDTVDKTMSRQSDHSLPADGQFNDKTLDAPHQTDNRSAVAQDRPKYNKGSVNTSSLPVNSKKREQMKSRGKNTKMRSSSRSPTQKHLGRDLSATKNSKDRKNVLKELKSVEEEIDKRRKKLKTVF